VSSLPIRADHQIPRPAVSRARAIDGAAPPAGVFRHIQLPRFASTYWLMGGAVAVLDSFMIYIRGLPDNLRRPCRAQACFWPSDLGEENQRPSTTAPLGPRVFLMFPESCFLCGGVFHQGSGPKLDDPKPEVAAMKYPRRAWPVIKACRLLGAFILFLPSCAGADGA